MITCPQLIDRITSLSYQNSTLELTKEVLTKLKRKQILIENFLQKLLHTAASNTEEDYLDILMQGRIALILAKNHFPNMQIEYSVKGPDIVATYYGQNIYFEVTRKRPYEYDESLNQGNVIWAKPMWGKLIVKKIDSKLDQLVPGAPNIVVLCSETVNLNRPDLYQVWNTIQSQDKYKDLSALLLTISVEGFTTQPWGLHLFKNNEAVSKLGIRLIKKLDNLRK